MIGKIKNPDVKETRNFALSWLAKRKVKLINERFLKVSERDAYEFTYYRKLLCKSFYITKVSIIRNGIEYLIQFSSQNWKNDKLLFYRALSSFKFEYSTENLF